MHPRAKAMVRLHLDIQPASVSQQLAERGKVARRPAQSETSLKRGVEGLPLAPVTDLTFVLKQPVDEEDEDLRGLLNIACANAGTAGGGEIERYRRDNLRAPLFELVLGEGRKRLMVLGIPVKTRECREGGWYLPGTA